jgi:septum site-determining protein MinC
VVPFQIRSRSLTAVVLQISGVADKEFYAALDSKLEQAPRFFAHAPFVLDLERCGLERSGDFTGLLRELRARRLAVIGVQNGTIEQNAAAAAAGLMSLQGGRETPTPGPRESEAAPAAAALLVCEPVRSGQRILADAGDLIVVAPVGAGAELIAHGNIHVYGPMRGRALAGVNGDLGARIFCQSLEAELIAIAGLYKTSEDLGPGVWKNRVQAFLDKDSLCVEALK